MNDLVSVLMCVYNTPVKYLKEAVQSILDQTYDNIEFVIVDDASDDSETVNYLKDIEAVSDRIVLVHNGLNMGLTQSLNVGLSQCHGKYIARMDSDDISEPERIAKQKEYMDQNKEVALVGSSIIVFGEGIQERIETGNTDSNIDPEIYRIRSLFQHSGPPHPTFMFRAVFLSDNGIKYREEIKKAQDYGIIVDILRAGGEIRKIYEPLLRYRIHEGQITSVSQIEQKAYQCRVSYDYVRSVFPNLLVTEALALTMLGNDYDFPYMANVILSNSNLSRAFGQINDLRGKSFHYVSAVRKAIYYNQSSRIYDSYKFETELRHKLWKKARKVLRELGRPCVLHPYILMSYRFAHKKEEKDGFKNL